MIDRRELWYDICRTRPIRRVSDVWWWLLHRVHPRHRYHVMRTGLTPGYYDPATRIVCGVLAEITHFVDSDPCIDWAWAPDHAEAWRVMNAAADFWREHKGSLTSSDDHHGEACKHIAALAPALGYMWYP